MGRLGAPLYLDCTLANTIHLVFPGGSINDKLETGEWKRDRSKAHFLIWAY